MATASQAHAQATDEAAQRQQQQQQDDSGSSKARMGGISGSIGRAEGDEKEGHSVSKDDGNNDAGTEEKEGGQSFLWYSWQVVLLAGEEADELDRSLAETNRKLQASGSRRHKVTCATGACFRICGPLPNISVTTPSAHHVLGRGRNYH